MQSTTDSKGKLERWHRTVRDQFLGELDLTRIHDLSDLNARLWAWIEEIYHRRTHAGLQKLTPLQRYQQDLVRIRTLGHRAAQLDQLFYHRLSRKIRKDATLSYQGQRFETPYELAGKTLQLVVDPHTQQAIWLEDDDGKVLGEVVALDVIANSHRRRHKPDPPVADISQSQGPNLVEMAYRQYHAIDDDRATPEKSTQTTLNEDEES